MPEKNDLQLRWSGRGTSSKNSVRKENGTALRRVEEYLDFLEEINPAVRDELPVKLYNERFELS